MNKSDFLILFIEMFQHLEDLPESVNQNLQCRMSQAGAGVKEPLSVRQFNQWLLVQQQERSSPMGFQTPCCD